MIKKFIRTTQKKLQRTVRRLNAIPIDNIIRQLEECGIEKGDAVFVHSRLSVVGYIKEGPDLIIDYLLNKVGNEGHLFMPAFSSNGYSSEYLGRLDCFDVDNTPSRMGVLTQLFQKQYQAERSIHPTHSVLIKGPHSNKLIGEHHTDIVPFGEKSPFYKFLNLPQTKVLGLGTTIFPFTVFRVWESLVHKEYPLKVFLEKEYAYKYVSKKSRGEAKTLAHNPSVSNIRRNMLFEKQLLAEGVLRAIRVGNSKSYVLDTTNFLNFMKSNYEQGNLPYIGHYTDVDKYKVDLNRLFERWEKW